MRKNTATELDNLEYLRKFSPDTIVYIKPLYNDYPHTGWLKTKIGTVSHNIFYPNSWHNNHYYYTIKRPHRPVKDIYNTMKINK